MDYYGGAFIVSMTGSIGFYNNIFINNTAYCNSGAYILSSSGDIECSNNTIYNNSSSNFDSPGWNFPLLLFTITIVVFLRKKGIL